MSKHFEEALKALIKGQDANALFKSFVNEHLGIADEPVTEDDNDDKLSGDIDAEQEDTGLTEGDAKMVIELDPAKLPHDNNLEMANKFLLDANFHLHTDYEWLYDSEEDEYPHAIEFINPAMTNSPRAWDALDCVILASHDIEESDALLTMKTAPEIHLTSEQEHQAFFLKYNEWRGQKSENEDNLVEIRTQGRCLAEIHCEMEDQYTLQIFELGGNYYGLTTTINTGERDYYEDLGFDNDQQVDEFLSSI
jgi:hypothetical protein